MTKVGESTREMKNKEAIITSCWSHGNRRARNYLIFRYTCRCPVVVVLHKGTHADVQWWWYFIKEVNKDDVNLVGTRSGFSHQYHFLEGEEEILCDPATKNKCGLTVDSQSGHKHVESYFQV